MIRTRDDSRIAIQFLAPYLVFALLFLIGPLFYGFWISLHKWQLLGSDTHFIGAKNYVHALKDDLFWKATVRTGLFILLTVPFGNLVSLLFAMALNQKLRGTTALRVMFYLPAVLSVSVVSLLWQWIYAPEGGLFNTTFNVHLPFLSSATLALPSIALLSVWWGVGGNMLIYLAALKGIPKEYLEAAELDGAIGLKRFIQIALPIIKPALLFGIMLSIIGSSQVFGQIYILTGGTGGPAYSTLSLVLYMYQQGFSNYQLGYGSAVAYLLFGLILLFSLPQLRMLRAEAAS